MSWIYSWLVDYGRSIGGSSSYITGNRRSAGSILYAIADVYIQQLEEAMANARYQLQINTDLAYIGSYATGYVSHITDSLVAAGVLPFWWPMDKPFPAAHPQRYSTLGGLMVENTVSNYRVAFDMSTNSDGTFNTKSVNTVGAVGPPPYLRTNVTYGDGGVGAELAPSTLLRYKNTTLGSYRYGTVVPTRGSSFGNALHPLNDENNSVMLPDGTWMSAGRLCVEAGKSVLVKMYETDTPADQFTRFYTRIPELRNYLAEYTGEPSQFTDGVPN